VDVAGAIAKATLRDGGDLTLSAIGARDLLPLLGRPHDSEV